MDVEGREELQQPRHPLTLLFLKVNQIKSNSFLNLGELKNFFPLTNNPVCF